MKKRIHETIVCVLIVLTAIPFGIFNYATPKPNISSGNGNPALLVLPCLIIFFPIIVYCFWKILSIHPLTKQANFISILLLLAYVVIALTYQINSILKYRQVIVEANKNQWEYANQISSIFDIHMNNQLYNLNTYSVFWVIAILCALIILRLQKKFKTIPR